MAEHIIFCGKRFLIADFYIPRDNGDLVLEIDGKSHRGKEGYDRDRDKYLKDQGISTLRFTNTDVLKRPDMVKKRILEVL